MLCGNLRCLLERNNNRGKDAAAMICDARLVAAAAAPLTATSAADVAAASNVGFRNVTHQ